MKIASSLLLLAGLTLNLCLSAQHLPDNHVFKSFTKIIL